MFNRRSYTVSRMVTRQRPTITCGLQIVVCALLSIFVWLIACNQQPISAAQRPNILFVLADDLGWNDVGFHGSEIETPYLDQLAESGVVLDQHYVTPVCSSTRAALLSGRYPSRFGCVGPTNNRVFPQDTVTLATALQTQGYETCITGKWHLGSLPQWGPRQHGFQYSYGCLAGGVDQYLHLYKKGPFSRTWHRNDQLIEEEGHTTDLFVRQAIQWIESKRDTPFFIYIAFTAVHVPLQEPPEWLGRYEGQYDQSSHSRMHFAACATHMDNAIGQMLDALDRTGQRENTIVIFTSDNGGQHKWQDKGTYPGKYFDCPVLGDNRPLRGWKHQLYEGAIRVPTIVHWPNELQPHLVKQPCHIVDWMPTLASLAGYAPETDLRWDGQDIWPSIRHQETPLASRDFYWKIAHGSAVRDGNWKLIVRPRKQGRDTQLFDLSTDPNEKHNLARKRSDKVAAMQTLLARHQSLDRKKTLSFKPTIPKSTP